VRNLSVAFNRVELIYSLEEWDGILKKNSAIIKPHPQPLPVDGEGRHGEVEFFELHQQSGEHDMTAEFFLAF
jgi:hypothetical protein